MMPTTAPASFETWQQSIPERIRSSSLWSFGVYPKSSFLYELVWCDCELLMKDSRGRAIVEQVIRSAGSICANIEEGYGRGFGLDYAHFLGYALGIGTRDSRLVLSEPSTCYYLRW